jgi:hypothetical protein
MHEMLAATEVTINELMTLWDKDGSGGCVRPLRGFGSDRATERSESLALELAPISHQSRVDVPLELAVVGCVRCAACRAASSSNA